MNTDRKLKRNVGNLKTELKRKRRKRNFKSFALAIIAVLFLVLVVSGLVGVLYGIATVVVDGYKNPELIYSTEALSFMDKMYEVSEISKPEEQIAVEENDTATVSHPNAPVSSYEYHITELEKSSTVESESIIGFDKDSSEWAPYPAEAGPTPYVTLSEHEKEVFAILIYLEAGAEPLECQYACASVVLNRYTTGNYDSILDVIYAKGQFSPAHLIEKYEPKDKQLEIVEWLCTYGPTIPEYVTYFRASYYHTWSNLVDWKMIEGNTNDVYFSYDPRLKAKWEAKHSAE